MKPLAIDLYCGLGGWTEGLLKESYDVIGFDCERHIYGEYKYPAQLVLQDVRTIHGKQFSNADLIVASPPCTEYSYMSMPWSRAKQIERALMGNDEFPENYRGSKTIDELNELFDACFRIQKEAIEVSGKYIPLIVENVRGAQKWVGQSRWCYGSYHLWADVPAIMPIAMSGQYKDPGCNFNPGGKKWLIDKQKGGNKNRKMSSAMIAKIPLELSRHIAAVYKPRMTA